MKFLSFRFAAAIAIACAAFGAATAANATPLETISWSGTLGYGTDGNPAQFGGANYAQLGGLSYSISLSYDPSALTNDSCGSSTSINYCNWVFGASGITEVIVVNGHAPISYTSSGPGGTLGIGVSNDQINISIGGIPQFGLNISNGGTALFASITNANNPTFAFTNVSVNGSFNDSNLGGAGGASLGGNISKLSATYSSGVTTDPVAVPEPLTVSLFGAGLAGAVGMRRRKKNAV
jgi:hypothetical protein